MHLGEFVKESDILYDYFSENPRVLGQFIKRFTDVFDKLFKKNLSNLMSTE